MFLVKQAVERPPEGLARGLLPAPAWFVASIAGLIVLGIATFFVVRYLIVSRRTERQRVNDSVAPPSSRR